MLIWRQHHLKKSRKAQRLSVVTVTASCAGFIPKQAMQTLRTMLAPLHPFPCSASSFFSSDAPTVPELKLVYIPAGNQMPLNVHSLELPGWGEQFVPVRAALRKCPVCNADTSSNEHCDRWGTGTEPAPHLPLTPRQYLLHRGTGSHEPPSAGGVFESSLVIALCLLY